MRYTLGEREFEAEGRYLTLHLRESNDIRHHPAALNGRLAEDGYLLVRGLHERSAVMAARESILERLASRGALDPGAPPSAALANPEYPQRATYSARNNADLKTDSLKALVHARPVMEFFDQLFGSRSASFRFQWPRAIGPGAFSPIHCDAPFMSRGSRRLLTCWTPLDDVPPELGPLAICEGSHRWRHVVATYGQSDVDRDLTTGTFSEDPAELVDRFAGRWATTTFEAGDAVILSMHTIHASLTNITDRFRISCDTRYQPREDPMDDRWAGDDPPGHEHLWNPESKLESVADSRRRWGI